MMIKQLQDILDRQATALDSRDPSIRSIRQQLDSLLETLQLHTDADAAAVEPKLKYQLEKRHIVQNKIENAEKELADICGGPTATALEETRLELEEVEKQLELLHERKASLQKSLKNQSSLVDGQRKRLGELIASLKTQKIEVDTMATAELESKLQESKMHSKACMEGRKLWKAVCSDLDAIDTRVSSSPDLADSLVALEDAAGRLYTHLQFAKSNNWQLMVTAIGHEYAAVDQAIDQVRRVLAKP